jgi:phosphoribosylformylglycinamidine cyclo-ligase
MRLSYKKVGIDIEQIKQSHRRIAELISKTWKEVGLAQHYASIFKLGKERLAFHCDGVGTKVLVAHRLRKYDTIGIDCVAMNVNDLVCVGARPLAMVDYLALERYDEKLVEEVMKGLARGAREANVALVGGELAVMKGVVKGFDLAAACLGVIEGEVIDGRKIEQADLVIGLRSSGIHSNGLTLARKILFKDGFKKRIARELLKPTRIYVKVLEVIKQAEIHGLAHITGGAFAKLRRIGRIARIGFSLDDLPSPPKIFKLIQSKGQISTREMYRTFNMGIGFILVAPEQSCDILLDSLKEFKPAIVGKVIKGRKVLVNEIEVESW